MKSRPELRVWSHEPLPADVQASLQRLTSLNDVLVTAAMPDIHLAKGVCVGAVVGTASRLFPAAVGGDIGCGMCALRFDVPAELVRDKKTAARLLRFFEQEVPTAQHPSRRASLPDELAAHPLSAGSLEKKKATIGRVQFATLGRGNHFVELQKDDEGMLWLMVHTGSRGIGQAIRDHHVSRATGPTNLESLDAADDDGQRYLDDMAWALDYAQLSRRRIAETIARGMAELVGAAARWDTYIECHHNFVRRETHAGRSLWVHRKGAISAHEGEPGVIPGSMGSPSYHVVGRGHAASLCSSSHGAGRVLSRVDARRVISTDALLRRMEGVLFDCRLSRRLRDEAPQAYKDIGAVMRAQRALTRIVRQVRPLLVYKGT